MIALSLILIGYYMVPDPKELPGPRSRTLADPPYSNWSGLPRFSWAFVELINFLLSSMLYTEYLWSIMDSVRGTEYSVIQLKNIRK